MRLSSTILLILATALARPADAGDSLRIAAAADLKPCLDEIASAFTRSHADAHPEISYGSSGSFAAQIRQGAPYDLFFSADMGYPQELAKDGFAASEVRPYAVGRLVLWSTTMDASKMTIADLARTDVGKIAIANPRHAPYGKRAEEVLRSSGIWDRVEARLVLGESIAQTAQFVESGNAQIGIVALSLVLAPGRAANGGYYLVPADLHQPLEQGFIVTRRAAGSALVAAFADYVQTPGARRIMLRYGFGLPGDGAAR